LGAGWYLFVARVGPFPAVLLDNTATHLLDASGLFAFTKHECRFDALCFVRVVFGIDAWSAVDENVSERVMVETEGTYDLKERDDAYLVICTKHGGEGFTELIRFPVGVQLVKLVFESCERVFGIHDRV
jgi:hypothetical protein